MDRYTSLSHFRLETDPIVEQNAADIDTDSTTSNTSHIARQQKTLLQAQRSQARVRRPACSGLQNIAIPEEHVYSANHRRASLFVDRPSHQKINTSTLSSCDHEPTECDYALLCRQKCQSYYGLLTNSPVSSTFVSPLISSRNAFTAIDDDDNNEDDEPDEDKDVRSFKTSSPNSFRHSLPGTSLAGLGIRSFLKRNKTTSYHHHRLGLSSRSLCSLTSSSSSILANCSSPLSTFRNFLSIVKLQPSSSTATTTKSIDSTASTTSHHSNLTTLTSATSGPSTPLDQAAIPLVLPKKRSTTNNDAQHQWYFESGKSQWCSRDSTSKITLGSIELHNLTYAEHKHLKRLILERLQSSRYDLGVTIHVPKEEAVRKRKHLFMFRSKSSDKSKETTETKSNGNIFGVALSQCVIDDDYRCQDEINPISSTVTTSAGGTNRKTSIDIVGMAANDRRTSPSESVSSTNDSGYSISSASPNSFHIPDRDYEQTKVRSLSLEALAENETNMSINRCNTLRCYPAKVPELIQNCCEYLEKNALQTVGLFRVGVSKKRLKELKDQVNSNRSLTFDSSTNAHAIAGLIKEFLRELPEPLLTRDLCTPFLNVSSKLNPKDQFRALSYLIGLLPSSNRDTLYTLLKFLYHVSLNAQDRCSPDGKILTVGNKMDAANLAIVFAPTILMDGKAPAISSKDMRVIMSADQMEQGKAVLKMMIEQHKELFNVPKELHDQLCLALYESDKAQLTRALAFKIQQGCGITSKQLDETNENLLMSLDLTPILCEISNTTTSIFSSIIPQTNRSNQRQQQQAGPSLRRYNNRRNSDFPCSSTYASRSSEFLQVPMSSSQQRLTNFNQQLSSKLPRTRDIREAGMDQIIFRVVEPFSTATNEQEQSLKHPTEPIINIGSFDEISTSPIIRPNSLDIKEAVPSSPVSRTSSTIIQTSETSLVREIKPYARSKTAPLSSSSSGAQNFLSVKRREARDLCGSSSNDDSPSPTSGHHSTLV